MARRRPLTPAELEDAVTTFRDSIDYDRVAICRGSLFALISATTIGNTINLSTEHFAGESLELSQTGRLVLIHELAHIWQFQNGGFAYIRSSLVAQTIGLIKTGSRRAAYDWRKAHDAGRPWSAWNAEQQAECISQYHAAAGCADRDTMRTVFRYMRRVRNRDGAPGR
jgi:hypothetical protein